MLQGALGWGLCIAMALATGVHVIDPGESVRLLSPPQRAVIKFPEPTRATTLLRWQDVPEAAAFHLLVFRTSDPQKPLVNLCGLQDSQYEARGLPPGDYHWQVAVLYPGAEQRADGSCRQEPGLLYSNFWFTVEKGTPSPFPQLEQLR